jgi:hypothetical protein
VRSISSEDSWCSLDGLEKPSCPFLGLGAVVQGLPAQHEVIGPCGLVNRVSQSFDRLLIAAAKSESAAQVDLRRDDRPFVAKRGGDLERGNCVRQAPFGQLERQRDGAPWDLHPAPAEPAAQCIRRRDADLHHPRPFIPQWADHAVGVGDRPAARLRH